MMKDSDPIEQLKNLGPQSGAGLRDIGIRTVGELRRIGAAEAFIMLRQHNKNFNRAMLWAMAMGLEDRHWQDITAQEKRELDSSIRHHARRL